LKYFPKIDNSAADYYYMVPERFYTIINKFLIGPLSPYESKLHEYSLRIYEAGLRQHWIIEYESDVKKAHVEDDESLMLNMEDVLGAFYCLGIGFAVSAIAFVYEKFGIVWWEESGVGKLVRGIGRRWRQWRGREVVPIELNTIHELV
jgi:hypothetical protein